MSNFYSIFRFSLFGCPCVFVVSGLDTTFQSTRHPGNWPPDCTCLDMFSLVKHHPSPPCEMCQVFKAFRMWKSTDMFVEYILSKTISCSFILLKMTILLESSCRIISNFTMASADSNPVFLLPFLLLPLLLPPFCELWSIQFTLSHRDKERKSTVVFPITSKFSSN